MFACCKVPLTKATQLPCTCSWSQASWGLLALLSIGTACQNCRAYISVNAWASDALQTEVIPADTAGVDAAVLLVTETSWLHDAATGLQLTLCHNQQTENYDDAFGLHFRARTCKRHQQQCCLTACTLARVCERCSAIQFITSLLTHLMQHYHLQLPTRTVDWPFQRGSTRITTYTRQIDANTTILPPTRA